MVTKDGAAQLIDLGLCIQVPEGWEEGFHLKLQHGGKSSYMCPEVAQERDAFDRFAADIWSLGVCLYTMLTSRPLYQSCQ